MDERTPPRTTIEVCTYAMQEQRQDYSPRGSYDGEQRDIPDGTTLWYIRLVVLERSDFV